MKDHYIHTLPNGISLIHQPNDSSIAHCGLVINAGSRDENESEHGIAHFIEHVLFKGTQKRKSFHILNRMETVGGELNAYTTKEETCIYASFMTPFYERAIELISDITFNSVFPPKELAKEKEVIIDEINSYLDNPIEQIQDDFEELVFGTHALAHPILGTEQSVKSFSQKHIISFLQSKYTAPNIVLSSVGNIPFEKLVYFSEKHLGQVKIENQKPSRKHFKGYKPVHKTLKKDTHQCHCVMGNLGYENKNKNKAGLVLLNNLLGGPGMNSRLNLAIREKYGLTYNLESNYSSFEDTGLFSIYLGCDPEDLERCIRLVYKELQKLQNNKLGTLQLKQAKQQLIGQIALSQESKASVMLGLGKSLITYGRIDSLQKSYKKIEAITSENLLEIANEVFDESLMSMLVFQGK